MDIMKKKMVAKHIDDKWNNTAIYVNEQMTSTFRNLFFKTRNIAIEVGYKFIWFKNNKIFVKKNEGSMTINIEDEEYYILYTNGQNSIGNLLYNIKR